MKSWDTIHAVQNMQDYIEQHLKDDITLYALAQLTGYSPWHASRLFKEMTGKTPFEYIRARRLSKAALDLQKEETHVITTALDYMFDSHEGFTRAFRKEFGITPKLYQKKAPPLYLFQPSGVRDYYRKYQGNDPRKKEGSIDPSFFVQVIHFPERWFVYKPGVSGTDYFSYCEEIGCDVWGLLCSIREALYEPVGAWLPKNLQPKDCSVYVQGVEIPLHKELKIPEGFLVMKLPACEMMLFQGAPFQEEVYDDAIDHLMDVINHYEPSLYGYEWADTNGPRIQLEPQGYRGYIEARPVRSIKEKTETNKNVEEVANTLLKGH